MSSRRLSAWRPGPRCARCSRVHWRGQQLASSPFRRWLASSSMRRTRRPPHARHVTPVARRQADEGGETRSLVPIGSVMTAPGCRRRRSQAPDILGRPWPAGGALTPVSSPNVAAIVHRAGTRCAAGRFPRTPPGMPAARVTLVLERLFHSPRRWCVDVDLLHTPFSSTAARLSRGAC